MKCDFCGGTLSLEDEKCPFCGQPNPHAQKHIEDMRRYKGEFEQTKKYVYSKTRTYTQIVVRMIILATLVILSVGLYVLASDAYSLTRRWKQSRSVKRYEEYSKILDQYLAEENFRAFESFRAANLLNSYYGEYAERYGRLMWVDSYYVDLIDYLSGYAFPKYYKSDQQTQWIAERMESFYNYMEHAPVISMSDVEEEPFVAEALDKMEKNIQNFLIVFCGFTREEAQSMRELSTAKRQILLEEKLEERSNNEE